MRATRSKRLVALAAVTLAGLGLMACGSSGGGSDASRTTGGGGGATTTTAPTVDTGGGQSGNQGKPHGKIRVVNEFLKGDQPFGPIDIYDVPNPDTDAKPLIEGLKYGEVSEYVAPTSQYSDTSNLYVFPAGSKTKDDGGIGGTGMSNAGWSDGDQVTLVVSAATGLSPGDPNNLNYTEISESDPSVIWKVIDGKGAILVNISGAGVDAKAAEATLVVDGKCPMRVDPENSPGGGQGVDSIANGNAVAYAVDPGSHDIGLLAKPYSTAITECAVADEIAKTTVDVPASGRVEVFIHGSSPTDLEVTTATVDEP